MSAMEPGYDPRSGLPRRAAGEWRTYLYLQEKCRGRTEPEFEGLLELASTDLREADAFHEAIWYVWNCDRWRPEAYDSDLFLIVVMIYVSLVIKADATQFQACLASTGISEAVLRRLSEFCGHLESLRELLRCLDNNKRGTEAIEEAWEDFGTGNLAWWPECPRVVDVLRRIVSSTYFLSPPRREADGPSCAMALARIRELIRLSPDEHELREMERQVVEFYVKEGATLKDTDWDDYHRQSLMLYLGYEPAFMDSTEPIESLLCELEEEPPVWDHPSCGQLKSLLTAAMDSQLCAALFFQKPPHSKFVSHFLAVYDCTVHARLWLLDCWLPPYAAFPHISYHELGKQVNREEEAKALESPLGFMESVPSFVEKLQRMEAIYAHNSFILHAKERGREEGIVFPIRSPQCSNVLVPVFLQTLAHISMVDTMRHRLTVLDMTFWRERKLEVFLQDEQRLELYKNTPLFLKLREHIRDVKGPGPNPFDMDQLLAELSATL